MARIQSWNDVVQALRRKVWFCIASGPSLTQADCDLVGALRLERDDVGVITINNTWQLAPWADVLYAGDLRWWRCYRPEFDGVKISWSDTDQAIQARYEQGQGLGRTKLRSGKNSGYQAANLAYLFGARVIVLLGYDMQATGGRKHWHPDHAGKLTNIWNFKDFLPRFARLARDLESENVRVINATRETALTCFQRMELEKVIEYLGGAGVGSVHVQGGRGVSQGQV